MFSDKWRPMSFKSLRNEQVVNIQNYELLYIIYELLFTVHYLKEALFILENGRYA